MGALKRSEMTARAEPSFRTWSPRSALAIARPTLEALAAPRRLAPIAVLVLPLLFAQARAREPAGIAVGVALSLACAVLAPISWRALATPRATVPRVLAYAALGAIVVLAIGLGLPLVARARPTFLTLPTSLLVSIALYWVGGFGLGRDIELEAALTAERARAEALAREAERAELLALRANLDPHFLFNTLNAIAEWCRIDGAIAEQAVLRLATMMRAILDGIRVERWPLERETALVASLFELHAIRDPARFTFRLDVAGDAATALVPPLILMPLAENAMKHGPSAGHRGEVLLSIDRARGVLSVRLSNPGPYKGPRPGSDGLPTVERRLALAYRGRAALRISGDADRTTVELDLPEVTS